MYPLGLLTAELQSASRRLLDVFEVPPHTKAAGERRNARSAQLAGINLPFGRT